MRRVGRGVVVEKEKEAEEDEDEDGRTVDEHRDEVAEWISTAVCLSACLSGP